MFELSSENLIAQFRFSAPKIGHCIYL